MPAYVNDPDYQTDELLKYMKDNWQTIDNAPRGNVIEHGPRILLGWAGRQDVAIARCEGGVWRDGYGGACIDPTHWQPLPPPPGDEG